MEAFSQRGGHLFPSHLIQLAVLKEDSICDLLKTEIGGPWGQEVAQEVTSDVPGWNQGP